MVENKPFYLRVLKDRSQLAWTDVCQEKKWPNDFCHFIPLVYRHHFTVISTRILYLNKENKSTCILSRACWQNLIPTINSRTNIEFFHRFELELCSIINFCSTIVRNVNNTHNWSRSLWKLQWIYMISEEKKTLINNFVKLNPTDI